MVRYRFGEFELLPERYELRRSGAKVEIEPRALEMLSYLVANRGRAVDKDELLEKVWEQEFLGDSVLSRTARKLREALDDTPRQPRFIKTVYGRGYVFIGEVESVDDAEEHDVLASSTPASAPAPDSPSSTRREAPTAGTVVALGIGITALLGLVIAGWILFGPKDAGGTRSPGTADGSPSTRAGGGARDTAAPAAEHQPPNPSIAVLPLRSLVSNESLDYLRVAIPSEITTLLSRVPALGVRPFSAAIPYLEAPAPPQAAGKTLGATHIVTGQYMMARGELRLTLEAIDVESNDVIWSDTVAAAPDDEIALMERVSAGIGQGLAPLLGAATTAGATRPSDPRAFSLYLRTLAMAQDPEPNERAVAMLEASLELDPGYAPAWAQLSRRLYLDAFYSGGGAGTEDRSLAALGRALELDPDLVAAIALDVEARTERGDLEAALDLAEALLRRHPDSAAAYFARGYVFRFAGLQGLAAADCERAVDLAPANPRWRSCALTMGYLGRFERARAFLALEPDSAWDRVASGYLAIMRGNLLEAREHLSAQPEELALWRPRARLVELCLEESPDIESQAARAVAAVEDRPSDSEDLFALAQLLAVCELRDMALPLLRSAVEGGFCAGPAFGSAGFRPLAGDPEFAEIVAEARTCTAAVSAHWEGR